MSDSAYRLTVEKGAGEGTVYPLPTEGVLRAGTARNCQILISGDGVLPVHFFVKSAGGRAAVLVQDEAAKLTVNGKPVRKKMLEPGDRILAGDITLLFDTVLRDELLGEMIGGYRVDSLLGKGAMGTVYRATQISLDRPVALKILSPELTKDAAFVSKFLEEARAAAKLNHPNVVQVYDAAEVSAPAAGSDGTGKVFYFSMEFLPGGTLQKLLDRDGKIPVQKALAIGRDAARALAYAEEHGIVHRDIKPANLLFAANGTVKLADLGIAGDMDRMMEGVDALHGAGSPRYMAPEQCQKKAVDHRADIYALGSTLFRAIAGRHVFDAKSAAEVLKVKCSQDPPRLDQVEPTAPSYVADLLHQTLSRDPAKRPRSCAELVAALDHCATALQEDAEEAAEVEADAAAPDVGAALPRRRKRRSSRGSPWKQFVESTPGKLNLAGSSILVLFALVWPVSGTPPTSVGGGSGNGGPIAATPSTNASKSVPSVDSVVPKEAKRSAVTGAESAKTSSGSPRKSADPVLNELKGLQREYISQQINAKRFLAALEDFKRRHPDPDCVAEADRMLQKTREGLIEVGKAALSRFVTGELGQLLDQGEYREASLRLVRMGEQNPLNLKEINAEVDKLEQKARESLQKTRDAARVAVAKGDFAGAIGEYRKIQGSYPAALSKEIADSIAILERDQKEFAEVAAPLEQQIELVIDAILALDFAQATSKVAALPQPKSELLRARRAAIASEVQLTKAAWEAIASGAKKGGKAADAATLALPAKELLKLLDASPPADRLEGAGLLVLYFEGPERAREILLDARLGAAKTAAYKTRLTDEEEVFLSRYARRLLARCDALKAARGNDKARWTALSTSILDRIKSSRSLRGYPRAKKDLATAYLRARAEVLRANSPENLFRGKVKSYKPDDGAIEIVYDFSSAEQLKDLVPVGPALSRLELDEKTVKARGEFRYCRGDVFKKRIGVVGRLPANSYSPQALNLNFAFWTRANDSVTPRETRGGPGEGDEDRKDSPRSSGVPRDYFVIAMGYKPPPNYQALGQAIVTRGGSSVEMPAYAVFGGYRGQPLHVAPEAECFWANSTGRLTGNQAFRVIVTGATVNSWVFGAKSPIPSRELKSLEPLAGTEPYFGSFTIFTNGEIVTLDSLAVEGELNPAWIDEQLTAIAETELRQVESSP